MCGIAGIVNDTHNDLIAKIVNQIKHRGPDNYGIFSDKRISLGHTRLSIQDLSANGHQPMTSSDGNYIIIFNGEIYNHFEIRKKLELKYSFKSTSDTETLLYGYIEHGIEILNLLNGIFAFAIYNKLTGDLLIARDQFGVKPLYYYQTEEAFLFGSEIKSFLQFPDLNKDLDFQSFVNHLSLLWSTGDKTPFKKIRKLREGHYIKINVNTRLFPIRPIKYYDIPFSGKYLSKTEDELIKILEEKLLAAVKRQMLSDVPVGFFLSGGLDSSAIVAMARKLFPKREFKCFTIDTTGMEEAEGFVSDLRYAKLVANHLQVDLEIVKSDFDIVKDFDKMIFHLDEPQADPAPLNVLNICTKAREMGFKVLLGGTAGDDLFSGYRRHQALAYENVFKFIPPFAGKFIKKCLGWGNTSYPNIRRARKLFSNIEKSKIERMKSYFLWLSSTDTKNLFTDKVKESLTDFDPLKIFDDLLLNIPEETSDLNKMLYWELKTFLPDHNLNYTDKMSMAVGVEVRVPFLDKELVEFSTQIPPSLKIKGTTTKYLLKKAMEKYLPHEVIYRPKAGFGAPVRKWICGELEPMIKERLSFERLKKGGIFNPETVWKLIEDNKAGKVDASYSIWALLAIDSWLNQFADH